VSLALANGDLIRRYKALAGLFTRIQVAQATAVKFGDKSPHANKGKFDRAMEQLGKLEKKLKEINDKSRKEFSSRVVGAFVTFQHEESVRRCLEDYEGSDSSTNVRYWMQAPPLRFGGQRLTVKSAPDPSQIVWEVSMAPAGACARGGGGVGELGASTPPQLPLSFALVPQNLELSWSSRCMRQGAMTFILVVLLIISLIFIMVAQAYQTRFRASIPNLGLCGSALPAISFNVPLTEKLVVNGTLPPNLLLVRDPSTTICTSGKNRLYWNTTSAAAAATRISSPIATDPCLNECYAPNEPGRCSLTFPDKNVTFARENVVTCYCLQQLRDYVRDFGVFTGLRRLYNDEFTYCKDSAQVRVVARWLHPRTCVCTVTHAPLCLVAVTRRRTTSPTTRCSSWRQASWSSSTRCWAPRSLTSPRWRATRPSTA